MRKFILFLLSLGSLLSWSACNNASSDAAAATEAWVGYNSKAGITLFGKKIALEDLKTGLYDSLSRMDILPDSISIHYEGEVLMGMRGEIETETNDALHTAVARQDCEKSIHRFYTWYNAFLQDESKRVDFVNYKGDYLKIDQTKLDEYLGYIKDSGFISDIFIADYRTELEKMEEAWQKEVYTDGPPESMDGDRFFCAQDWDLDFWTKAPVSINLVGDVATATMRGTEGGSPKEHQFELIYQDEKWILSKIACAME